MWHRQRPLVAASACLALAVLTLLPTVHGATPGTPDPVGIGPLGAPIRPADEPCVNTRTDELGAANPTNDIYIDQHEVLWPTATPDEVGLDAALLERGLGEAARAPTILDLVLIRHGKLVVERSFPGSAPTHSRNLHSATKGLVALVTGAAIADGFLPGLDTPIGQVVSEATGTPVGDVTLEQLLSMSGGVFQGDERHLVLDAIAHPLVAAPGTAWAYSDASVELVALALDRAVPGGLCRYAHRVLEPLGITVDHWHLNEQGNVTGRAYAFLTGRELARIGQLVLQRGRWGDNQVVPESWIRDMVTSRFDIGGESFDASIPCAETQDRIAMGLLWRVTRVGGYEAWAASGYGGQYVVVVPDLDLVMVVQHDTYHDAMMDLQRHVSPTGFLESFVLPRLGADDRNTSACSTDLAVGPLPGGSGESIAPGPGDDLLPDWSPDGTRLAFTASRDLNPEVYVVGADGSDLTRLTTDWAVDVFPRWSPDGSRLLFLSDRNAASNSGRPVLSVEVMDLATGQVRELVAGSGDIWAAAWTADGSVGYVRSDREDGLGELWVADADGGEPTLVPGPAVGWPAWSVDGSRIAVVTAIHPDEDEMYELGVLDPATGDVTTLGKASDLPSWTHDGRIASMVMSDDGKVMTLIDPATGARAFGPATPRGRLSPDGRHVAWPRSLDEARAIDRD